MAKSVMLKGMCILSVGSRKKLFPTETSLVGSSCPTSTLSLTSTQGHIRFLLLGFPIGVICKVVRVKKNVFSLDISLSGVYSLSSSCKCFFYLSAPFLEQCRFFFYVICQSHLLGSADGLLVSAFLHGILAYLLHSLHHGLYLLGYISFQDAVQHITQICIQLCPSAIFCQWKIQLWFPLRVL